MDSLVRLGRAAHAAIGFQRSTQLAGAATLLTLMIGTGAWLADTEAVLAGAMIVNAVTQVTLVAVAITSGLHDDRPTMPLPERLTRLGLFLATYAAGIGYAGWAMATVVLMAAYATVLSALGIIAGGWLAGCLARWIWEAGTLGLTRLLGAVLMLGGLAWMLHLGGPQSGGLDGLLKIFTLQAMAALMIASGGMMITAIRLR